METPRLKQVLIVRKDLKMRKGKIGAQCAHASLNAVMGHRNKHNGVDKLIFEDIPTELTTWLNDGYQTKVVVSVDSEDELLEVYNKAQEKGLISSIVTDFGLTEFKGVHTKTVVAVGPARPEDFIGITDTLKLM